MIEYLREDLVLYERYVGCVAKLKKDASPGVPWMRYGSTNAMVLEKYGVENMYSDFVDRIARCIWYGDQVLDMTPRELVENGIVDPVAIFIKDEPHTMKKIIAGKLRIISSVSVMDQLVTRAVCGLQNIAEIARWETCPSKPGMGLHDEGLLLIAATARDMFTRGDIVETDVSGWDWSVQQWELDGDAERRRLLAGEDEDSFFYHLLKVHAYFVGSPVYVLPNGEMYIQQFKGGQLSGDYNTSATNSAMRIMATQLARLRLGVPLSGPMDVVAMGDDSFERSVDGLGPALEEIGHKVKFVKSNTSLAGMEFCSHEFREDGLAFPVAPLKTMYRFLSHNPSDIGYPSYGAQLDFVLRHLPEEEKEDFKRTMRGRLGAPNHTWQDAHVVMHHPPLLSGNEDAAGEQGTG